MTIFGFRISLSKISGPLLELYSAYHDDDFRCMLSEARNRLPLDLTKTVPYSYLHPLEECQSSGVQHGARQYPIIRPNHTYDGITRYEFLAIFTGYTTGYECNSCRIQDLDKAEIESKQNDEVSEHNLTLALKHNITLEDSPDLPDLPDLPRECSMIWPNWTSLNVGKWPESCDIMFRRGPENIFCSDVEGCNTVWTAVFNDDLDGNPHLLNEEEFIQIGESLGLGLYIRPGIFKCLRALGGPRCMENIGNTDDGFQTRTSVIPGNSIWGKTASVDGPLDVLTSIYFFDDLAIESWDEGLHCEPCSINQIQYYLWRLVKIDNHPVSDFDELVDVYSQYDPDYCCVTFTLQGPDHIPIMYSITEDSLILGEVDYSNQGAEWGHIEEFLGWNLIKVNDLVVTDHDSYRDAWESVTRDHDVVLTFSETDRMGFGQFGSMGMWILNGAVDNCAGCFVY